MEVGFDFLVSTLDWHEDGVLDELWSQRESGRYVDVAFVCAGGKEVLAHRVVLECRSVLLSEVFREVACCCYCCSGQLKPPCGSRQTLILPEVEPDALILVLSLLYTGQVTVPSFHLFRKFKETCALLRLDLPLELFNTATVSTVSTLANQVTFSVRPDLEDHVLNDACGFKEAAASCGGDGAAYLSSPLATVEVEVEVEEGSGRRMVLLGAREKSAAFVRGKKGQKRKRRPVGHELAGPASKKGKKTRQQSLLKRMDSLPGTSAIKDGTAGEAEKSSGGVRALNKSVLTGVSDQGPSKRAGTDPEVPPAPELPQQADPLSVSELDVDTGIEIVHGSCKEMEPTIRQVIKPKLLLFDKPTRKSPTPPKKKVKQQLAPKISKPIKEQGGKTYSVKTETSQHPLPSPCSSRKASSCPVCGSLVPDGKVREHLAASHLNPLLRRLVVDVLVSRGVAPDTRANGSVACPFCDAYTAPLQRLARYTYEIAYTVVHYCNPDMCSLCSRHVGLRHDKIMEVGSEEEKAWVRRILPGRAGSVDDA